MKSSVPFSVLLVLPAIQAATLPRSQHDSMLERNFKNVLSEEPSKRLTARSPQGPASNPGEFTNVGLSNSNPQNQNGGTSSSGSGSGSNYVPEPMMDSQISSASIPSAPDATLSGVLGEIFVRPDEPYPPQPIRHPYRPFPFPLSGGPLPTGRHHRPHHNRTGYYPPNRVPPIVEVDLDIEPDGEIALNETVWRFNGTGWNTTHVPLPSGGVVGTVLPVPVPSLPMASVGVGRPRETGSSSSSGSSNPGFENGVIRPGFTGPRERLSVDSMTRAEIAADGTGAETGGVTGDTGGVAGYNW